MKYILTFKPLKNFFFGNDKTFSDDYVASSEYFPQNTQLLGAMRLFIAEQQKLMHVHGNGKYSNEPEKLCKLIGTAKSSNFSVDSGLGAINSLSQMFLVDKQLDDAYFPTPFDIEISKEKVNYYELANIGKDCFLKNYDVKKASSQHLANAKFWQKYINKQELSSDDLEPFDYVRVVDDEKKTVDHRGVFVKHSQIGIGLENKKTIEGAFYSKTDYKLSDAYLFACLFEYDEEIQDGIIQIGAESSLFQLVVHKYENTQLTRHPIVSKLFTKPQKGDKLVAISDVMLESTNELHAYFSIIPFHKKFAMIKKNRDKFTGKTSEKRVIPAGSVSYLKEEVFSDHPALGAYAKMGYNQFITAKK